MLKFVLRRLGASALVLFLASILVYFLITISGDPLADLRESNAENREQLMAARIAYMNLEVPWYHRYLDWLRGVGGCVVGQCDLGLSRQGVEVTGLLGTAASSTLRLVFLATVIAAVAGILLGLLTAVRQYSDLDYVVTFLAFVFFSLPSFWAAVLLKEYGAIRFNDWIADPAFSAGQIIVVAVGLGLVLQLFMGGGLRRRLFTFVVTAGVVGAAIPYFTWLNFARYPQLGPVGVIVVTAAVAALVLAGTVGFKERRVLIPAAISVGLVAILYFVTYSLLETPSYLILLVGLAAAVAVPWAVARALGGRYQSQAKWAGIVTAVVGAGLTVTDHVFRAWPGFLARKPRPISTIGSETPNFSGSFWQHFLDHGTQLLLPTLLLALISMAGYSRYTRSALIEVNGQDYVRTARAKGLPERTVIMRHAFRNAMIPIVTIAAFDFAGLIGGAVITEAVFGWKGMGDLFRTGLTQIDPNPVMAFFLITGTVAVLFNLLADIVYALIDPRIRT